jgi:hypothetical protein
MKKIVLVILALLSTVGIVYAQVSNGRNPAISNTTYEGKTGFTQVGIQGLDVQGNPGYLELEGVSTKSGTRYTYYLWVDELGKFRIASYADVSVYASFPNGDWNRGGMPVGTVVGGQS